MKLTVTFKEIREEILSRFGYDLRFGYVGPKQVVVVYDPGRFLPTVRVVLSVVELCNERVVIGYGVSSVLGTGAVIEHVLSRLVTLKKQLAAVGIDLQAGRKRIVLLPTEMKGLDQVCNTVALLGMTVLKDALEVEFALVGKK